MTEHLSLTALQQSPFLMPPGLAYGACSQDSGVRCRAHPAQCASAWEGRLSPRPSVRVRECAECLWPARRGVAHMHLYARDPHCPQPDPHRPPLGCGRFACISQFAEPPEYDVRRSPHCYSFRHQNSKCLLSLLTALPMHVYLSRCEQSCNGTESVTNLLQIGTCLLQP